MKMKSKIGKWSMVLVAAATITLFGFYSPEEKYFEIVKSLDIFSTLFKEVNAYYVDEIDPKKLTETSIHGMLESLDPYTDFIAEENEEAYAIQTTGQYAGIGALIGVVNKKVVVTHPYEGYPAEKAGIKVGDEFVSLDGKSVVGNSISDVSTLLKGKPKTEVQVVIKRVGQKDNLSFKVMRERIKISNVTYQGMLNTEIGFIKLNGFTPGAGKEVEAAVVQLKAKGAKKIILDLRNNPGGLLREAINIVNVFIPKGNEVVATKGKVQDWNKSYSTLNNPVDTEMPLVVLTNQSSASASEIVAGALQDYDRAVLVGQKTFGKGLVQTTRQLPYGSQLKITTAKYYIPSGRCIQALDYTHRKSDGTVERVADSLKSEFKTKAGRKVYDGGGLDPDLVLKNKLINTAIEELLISGYVFDYATKYCMEHAEPASMRNFKLSDTDYEKFVTWMKEKNFTYTTALERRTDDLLSAAKEERYANDLQNQMSKLQASIQQNRLTDLHRFKADISELLNAEIAFHYKLISGQIEFAMDQDEEIVEAKKILENTSAYKKILSPL